MDDRLRIAILAVAESSASTVYGLHDLLASAGVDWGMVMDGSPGRALIVPRIVTADGQAVRVGNGLRIEPHAALTDDAEPQVVIIPDLMVPPQQSIAGRYGAETAWLRALYANGVTLASACSGALLLAEAGLLDAQDATTHWAYCDAMARHYPQLRVHPQRALVTAGDGQRLIMAGGGSSWNDLGLFLIARFLGVEEAMRVARLYLLDWHHIGQQPFAALTRNRQSDDALIARCQAWIAENYEQTAPVAAMARLSGLAERSFTRRFTQATGMSPMEYVHTLRLEESKHLLETTRLPIEAVATEVGYEDASFFGRLFRRKVGLTPAHYRKRFAALRTALSGDAGDARATTQPG